MLLEQLFIKKSGREPFFREGKRRTISPTFLKWDNDRIE
jgi:hypothetical protein